MDKLKRKLLKVIEQKHSSNEELATNIINFIKNQITIEYQQSMKSYIEQVLFQNQQIYYRPPPILFDIKYKED